MREAIWYAMLLRIQKICVFGTLPRGGGLGLVPQIVHFLEVGSLEGPTGGLQLLLDVPEPFSEFAVCRL